MSNREIRQTRAVVEATQDTDDAVYLQVPVADRQELASLRVGQRVLLSGTIYTARDAAHRRMIETLLAGGEAPIPLLNSFIYYAGPTPAPPGRAIGSIGPTTSYRMDSYAPFLIERGLGGMIGKGTRSKEVVNAMVKHCCVYMAAVGGAGALLSRRVISAELVAYGDLGTEAIRRLEVKDFPVVVAIDTLGNNIYERR
jgi:fumarate hydratase subunit beta